MSQNPFQWHESTENRILSWRPVRFSVRFNWGGVNALCVNITWANMLWCSMSPCFHQMYEQGGWWWWVGVIHKVRFVFCWVFLDKVQRERVATAFNPSLLDYKVTVLFPVFLLWRRTWKLMCGFILTVNLQRGCTDQEMSSTGHWWNGWNVNCFKLGLLWRDWVIFLSLSFFYFF